MIEKIKHAFAVTDTGARGIIKASVGSFLMYVAYMLPMLILMFFSDRLLRQELPTIMLMLILFVICSVVMYVFIDISYRTTYNETYREAQNIRIHIANVLKGLPLSYFSRHHVSDVSQTVMQDVADLEHALSHAIPEVIGFMAYLIVISILLVVGQPLMGLAILLPLVVGLALLCLSKRMQVSATTRYFYQKRESTELFQETIELQQELRSYGKKEEQKQKLNENFNRQERMQIWAEIMQALPCNLSGVVIKLSVGLAVLVGSYLFANGRINLLFLIGYVVAANRILDGLTGLFMNMAEIMYLDARIQRIRELYEQERQEGEATEILNYDISLEDVSFGYQPDQTVVEGVNLTARQNEVTALIGPSGCGKTTLLRLIARLYDYESGSIRIGGKELKDISTETVFQNVSIVFQDISLFDMTVMENIRLGRPEATDDQVVEAARIANCDQFIRHLPQGYQTAIGENGMKLSGGERQRISIARTILKDAPIVLLDEISSALDVETETRIQEGLRHLIRGKTVLIISHRLRSVQNAHRIVLLDQGHVVASGSHEELMNTAPLYRLLREREALTEAFTY